MMTDIAVRDFKLWFAKAECTKNKGKFVSERGTLMVAQLVEALRYKPESRGFDSRWCVTGIFH
jgi:hypothetical protein